MASTVRVNERTVVHETSEGLSMAFPDVCIVPQVGPLPFVNVAFSKDAANTSATVYADGRCIMLKDSYFAKSVGDEPGTDGGVISGCWNGKASFSNYSFDVMIEGRNVARLSDPMVHNHGSPANAASPAETQPNAGGDDDMKKKLCEVFCMCYEANQTTDCCRRMMATPRYQTDPVAGTRRYWDPVAPGYYVEVPFDMTTDPPRPMMDRKLDDPSQPGMRSQNPLLRDPTGKGAGMPLPQGSPVTGTPGSPPLPGGDLPPGGVSPGGIPANDGDMPGMPLPGGDLPPIAGSKRPDVVTVNNPALPLDAPGNVKAVYDFKFPGDTWGEGQKEAYERIAPGHVHEISLEECDNCNQQRTRPVPVPVQNPGSDADKAAFMALMAVLLAIGAAIVKLGSSGGGGLVPKPVLFPMGRGRGDEA